MKKEAQITSHKHHILNRHSLLINLKFLGHNIERNTITPLKSRIDAIQKVSTTYKSKENPRIPRNVKFLK